MARKLAYTKDMPLEEWRKLRRNSIGGSDAATIVGFNNFSSLYTLYADKMGLLPEKEDSEAMRVGTDLEDYVAKRFVEATGKKVRCDNYMYQHDKYDFISANIDRKIEGENAGLECKTTSVFNKSDFVNGEIPLYYYCQCMHYMNVMGFDKMYLAVLVLGKAFYYFEIPRNDNEIKELEEMEVDFWNNYISTQTPPPIDNSSSTTETLKYLYSDDTGEENIYLGDDLENLVQIQKKIKEFEEKEKEYKNRIIEALGENVNGYSEKYIVTYKTQSRTSVDSAKLKKEMPSVYNKFSKTISTRTMKIKEAK